MKKHKIIIVVSATVLVIIFIIYKDNLTKEKFDYSKVIIEETKENQLDSRKQDTIKVYVTGEVINEGVVELEEGQRVEDAILKAGGLTEESNLKNINLAYMLEDGQKLYIPSINDPDDIEYTLDDNMNDKFKKVNINKATEEQLQALSGIGPSIAKEIVQYRDKNGKFKSIEDIKNVTGVGDKKYEKIKENIEIK